MEDGHELTLKTCPPWMPRASCSTSQSQFAQRERPWNWGSILDTEDHTQRGVFLKLLYQRTARWTPRIRRLRAREFLESPVVRAPCFHFQGWGFIPQLGGEKRFRAIPLPQVKGSPQPENLSSSLNSSLINTDLGRASLPQSGNGPTWSYLTLMELGLSDIK